MTTKEKIDNLKISSNSSLTETLKLMDEKNKKLLLVFENEKFISIVSIGDIQRAIIKNISLDCPIKNILRKEFSYCKINDDSGIIKSKMLNLRTEFMPILDDDFNLVDVYFWEDLLEKSFSTKNQIDVPVVIMAGGKGTRLKPITNIIPKPLIPLGDKPMIEVILNSFLDFGVNQFYFTVNYKAEMIKNYFDDINDKKYSIEYVYETIPLGTAGSLKLIKDKLNQTFFMINCDILIKEDYSEILKYHKENNNELTLIGALRHHKIPYGVMETKEDGLLDKIIEKPQYNYLVNAGLYILEPNLLNEIPDNKLFHITDLIEIVKKRNGRIGVFPVSEKSWLDIGEWKEYKTSWEAHGNDFFL